MEISKPGTSSRRDVIADAVIVEIVNDSDSVESEISEDQNNEEPIYLSFSISNEEDKEVPPLQLELERWQKRKSGTTDYLSDMGLGWTQSTCSVNTLAFSCNQRLNPNPAITEDSSCLDFLHVFFDSEILTVIQN
jgi:hypothetical protein